MSPSIRGVITLLEIFDMPTSIAFYRALGFEVVQHWGARDDEFDWVLLRLGGAELMLNTAYEGDERPPTPDPGRVRGHADTELFFDCAEVEEVCELLRGKGIVVSEPETTFYGTKRVRLRDPDGFQIWFQSPIDAN
jgi:glyoxylase I family protein